MAPAYLALRVLECLAIVIVGAYMLARNREVQHYDLLIYSFTAVGGIILSYLLYVSGLVPRPLSMLGMLGYVVLLLGIPVALLDLADLDTGWGMVFLVPGGLFELILPLLLLVRGFSVRQRHRRLPVVSLRRAALVAGLGLSVMVVLAFSSFSAFESLVVEGDATRTARNIAEHELLFRVVAASYVIVAVLDVVVAWAFYVLLRPVNRSIAMLSAWLRVAYAAVFVAASSNLFVAVRLVTDGNSLDTSGTRQLDAQVMTSVNQFNDVWDAALVIFGLHLLVLGYLVFRSNYLPSVLGILVAIAALGYLIDSVGGFLSKSYDANVAIFTFAGEVLLNGLVAVARSEAAGASRRAGRR